MIKEAKSYKVSILGDHYTIMSDEPEEHIVQAARVLDALLKEIAEKSAVNDTKKVAILAALQLSSKLVYAQRENELFARSQKQLAQRIEHELHSSASIIGSTSEQS